MKEEILKNYKNLAKEEIDSLKQVWKEKSVYSDNFESLDSVPTKFKKKLEEGNWVSVWVNIMTGEVIFKEPDAATISRNDYLSISIDEKYDAIKIVEIKTPIPYTWRSKAIDKSNKCKICDVEIYLSYIFKDKTVICTKPKNSSSRTLPLKDLSQVMVNAPEIKSKSAQEEYGGFGLTVSRYNEREQLKKVFSEFFGIGFLSGNTYTNFYDSSDALRFLCSKDIVCKDTPKQRKVDELVKVELPKADISFTTTRSQDLICVANRVNSEYAVLRYFKPTLNRTPYEISRLYVAKKDYIFARKNQEGKFCVCNNKLNAEHFESDDMVLDSEDIFDGTMLEYFKDIYKKLNNDERGKALYVLTSQPTFEKFYKMGFAEICTQYIQSYSGNVSWKRHLEDYFGPIDNIKEKNINKILGFNKYQMEKLKAYQDIYTFYSEYTWGEGNDSICCGLGAALKFLFKDVKAFNDIDNSSFDKIFDIFNIVLSHSNEYNSGYVLRELYKVLKTVIELYSTKTCLNVLPNLKDIIVENSSGSLCTLDNGYIRIFADYLNIIQQLDRVNEIKPYFNSKEDLVRIHDDAVITFNIQKDKVETERFKKRSSFWKKWEYSEDDNFVAIAPTVPADLAVEGITLHHCVKSYIQRVASGATNIMFIRKKDDIEKPFFTVEVSNDKIIEQVHGFANRNADTEPGLETFVKKWAKERKLKLNGINKVR